MSEKHLFYISFDRAILGIWNHLTPRRHHQVYMLIIFMLASGVAELLSLGSVVPFLAVLASPQKVWAISEVRSFAGLFSIKDSSGLLLLTSMLFGTAALLAAVVRLTNLWLNGRVAALIGSDLSFEVYRRTLYQSYELHVKRNTSSLITALTIYIEQTVSVIQNTLNMVTSAFIALAFFVGFLLASWQLAFAITVVFGSSYAVLMFFIRRRLTTNSRDMALLSNQKVQSMQEGLGAIRDIILENNQAIYLDGYRNADVRLRLKATQNSYLGVFPRYILELLGLLTIAVFALFMHSYGKQTSQWIPILGTFALGAQRLLPAMQQVYGGWAFNRSYNTAIGYIVNILDWQMPELVTKSEFSPFPIYKSIQLNQLSFRYSNDDPWVLNKIDLEFHPGERIGIVGTTGSGKSTMVDLLMGLLRPTSGKILIGGLDVHENQERLTAWRSNIAHVPQNIYLADKSIAENIAFGVPSNQIDYLRIIDAAEQAKISDYIESTPGGYHSFVGERGIRLSGGQRQRIAIARALYKQPKILILDEATSALDTETESAVMEAIEGLSRRLTIFLIAHRLSTVERCDRVISLDRGKVSLDRQPRKSTISFHSESQSESLN